MTTSPKNNKMTDPFEKIILEDGLRISDVQFDKEAGWLLAVLNNHQIIKNNLSEFECLADAELEQLKNWRLIGKGIGIHWPDLDEDLSLKGLIKSAALREALLKLKKAS